MTEAEGKRGRRFRKIIETYDKKKTERKKMLKIYLVSFDQIIPDRS